MAIEEAEVLLFSKSWTVLEQIATEAVLHVAPLS